jgi:hypothetical protein
MKLHEIYPHNKFLFFTSVILMSTGTYLDGTNKANRDIITVIFILGMLLILLSLKKPKHKSDTV